MQTSTAKAHGTSGDSGVTFENARARADALDAVAREAGKALDAFPRGAFNLIPDEVKATDAYREAKAAYDRAFAEQRRHNAWYVRTFKREIQQARANRMRTAAKQ